MTISKKYNEMLLPNKSKPWAIFAHDTQAEDLREEIKTMIYDSISNLKFYGNVFEHIIAFLSSNEIADMAPGRYEVADGIFLNVQDITTKAKNDNVCEVHKKYVDLQYVVSGTEKMLLGSYIENVPKIPYDADKDVAHFNAGMVTEMIVRDGSFCVFFPGEYHKPGLCITEPAGVRKALFKIDYKKFCSEE